MFGGQSGSGVVATNIRTIRRFAMNSRALLDHSLIPLLTTPDHSIIPLPPGIPILISFLVSGVLY